MASRVGAGLSAANAVNGKPGLRQSTLTNGENRLQAGKPGTRSTSYVRKPLGNAASTNNAQNTQVQGTKAEKALPSKGLKQTIINQAIPHDENATLLSQPGKAEVFAKKSAPTANTVSKIPRIGRQSVAVAKSDVCEHGFSTHLLPENVEDIDACDAGNVLLAPEYAKDIYRYLRALEQAQKVKANFLSVQREMSPKMRSVLVDWLINVHHQFKLLPETLYMGVSIMDRFFQCEPVSKDKIQLVGVTAFFIASKFEEIYPPDLLDFVVICDQLYSKKEIIKMEMVILRALKFELGRPLPLHFLRRNSKAAHADPKIHTMAKYLMEMTLLEHECSQWNPSEVAASALYVTLKLMGRDTPMADWNSTLAYYSNYTEEQILPFAAVLCKNIRKAERGRFQNCRKKYASVKFLEISKSPEFQSSLIDELAAQV